MAFSTLGKVVLGIIALVGIACCIGGGVFYKKFPEIAKARIEEALPIKNGTEAFDRWSESPVPFYWKVSFFNITNPDEINMNASVKPILQEVGPIVFRQKTTKQNPQFSENGTHLEYVDYRTYYHESGDIDAEINHLNLLYVILAGNPLANLKNLNRQLQEFASDGNFSLVETHTIRELLFDGYFSTTLEIVKKIDSFLRFLLNPRYPGNMFGLFIGRNGTFPTFYEINTGTDDVRMLGQITKFNHANSISAWTDFCSIINGTDATVFHPGISKEDELYVFTADLLRSALLVYEKDVAVADIDAYKFALPKDLFKLTAPENNCFCKKNDLCMDGVMKMNDMMRPVVFSAPHFQNGDPSLLQNVVGLKPDDDKHETYIIVEPNTGVVIKAAKRIQVNIDLKNVQVPFLETADGKIFPIAWVEESAEIDAETAQKFRREVINNLKLVPNLLIGLMTFGGLLVLISTVVSIYKIRS